MYTTTRVPFGERGDKERRALGWLERWWRAEVDSGLGVDLFREFEDVDVFWLHELFLDARGG